MGRDDHEVVSITRVERDERHEVVALQKAAYAANRTILGREPLPLLADYDDIFSRTECWVARAGPQIAGALFVEVGDDDLLVWSVATIPGQQGGGVGGQLMRFAEARAREVGRDTIRLYTGQLMTDRIAWYSRLGYLVERLEEADDRVVVHMKKPL